MRKALMRVINYPARLVIRQSNMVAANHYKRSIFEVMQNIDKIDLKLNLEPNKTSGFCYYEVFR
jgi:DNA helicase-2/ATP-dependent DNA helicase PcrA